MAGSVPRFTPIPAAVIEENRSQLGEVIQLSTLLPVLKNKAISLPSILDSADLTNDFKTAALLRHVCSSGQHVVNLFLEALHDDAHSQQKALELLEKARLDYKKKYPVLQVLDDIKPSIINVATLIPYLMREGVLTTEHYHEVSSKYVSHDDQVGRVLKAVKARGIKGLSTFVKCLRRTDEYSVIAKILTNKGDAPYVILHPYVGSYGGASRILFLFMVLQQLLRVMMRMLVNRGISESD